MNFRKLKIFGIKIFSSTGNNKWYQYWQKAKRETPSVFSAGQKLTEYRYYRGDNYER